MLLTWEVFLDRDSRTYSICKELREAKACFTTSAGISSLAIRNTFLREANTSVIIS